MDPPQIYLDNKASTPIDPSVRAAMSPYLAASYGNP
jgi:cysteine sulfinate desulfinase/cysteine desulfurase-like protein